MSPIPSRLSAGAFVGLPPAVAPSDGAARRGIAVAHEWLYWRGLSEHTCQQPPGPSEEPFRLPFSVC